jgi:MoaA/NifB/PqqE/SkfB family radical SAM enzyme
VKLSRLVRFGVKHLAGWQSRAVGINLTRRCNLACDYCRIVDNSREKFENELTVDQWKAIIGRFAEHGYQHFVFTGGEPTVYRGLDELVRWTSERAMTSLISNTTFLDEARFESLRHLDFITFSFDTMNADDAVFEKNPRRRLALIAEQCRRHDITPSAIVTVTSKNLDEVEPMVRALDDVGITAMLSLIHSDPDPGFDFRNHTPELEFRTEEDLARLEALAERLKQLKREGVGVAETDSFLDHMDDYARGRFQIDCPAADPFFTIDYDGRIKACHDTPASGVHALTFLDWEQMKRDVKATIKPGCNCYYNCYVYGRSTLKDDAVRLLSR